MRKEYVLLEQDGAKSGVEGGSTFLRQHLAETAHKTTGIGGLRHETDTGSLKRAEGNVGEELGKGGRDKVDTSSVV